MANEFQPYVGPVPFERKEQNLFFGRDRETRTLKSLVTAYQVVLFYARSGAGKTSLLNAGLIPALEAHQFEILPIARVHGGVPEGLELNQISNIHVFSTLLSWTGGDIDLKQLAEESLAGFLREREHHVGKGGVPSFRIAIFDQFEELFTSYPSRWKEREDFFRQLAEAIELDSLLRVLIVIREDHLASLDSYANFLPEHLRTCFRLERLKTETACQAVEGPLQDTEYSFAEGVALSLVQQLLNIRVKSITGEVVEAAGEYVEPVQLQVVCQSLWQNLPSDVTVITSDHLQEFGDVEEAIRSFYEKAIEIAMRKTGLRESDLRDWFNNKLITPAGTRGTVFKGKDRTEGIPNSVVEELETQHIIRAELRAGAHWYELTHDQLIEPIRKSNEVWLELQHVKEQQRQIEVERQRTKIQGRRVVLFGMLSVVAIVAAALARYYWIRAEQQRDTVILIKRLEQEAYLQNPSYDPNQGLTKKDIMKYFNLHRGSWWNYYARGSLFLTYGHYMEALSDFTIATRERNRDKYDARTYGMHFIDYFPNRESGVTYYLQGVRETEIALQKKLFRKAITLLEKSISEEESPRAKFYLNQARESLWQVTKKDKIPPTIHVTKPIYTNQRKVRFDVTVTDQESHVGDIQIDRYVGNVRIDSPKPLIQLAKAEITETVELTISPQDKNATVVIKASDLAGNESDPNNILIILDTVFPQLAYSGVEALPNGRVAAYVIAKDNFGLKCIQAGKDPNDRFACNGTLDYSGTISGVPENGKLVVVVDDNAGNTNIVNIPVEEYPKPSPLIGPNFNFPAYVRPLNGLPKETSQNFFIIDGILRNPLDITMIKVNADGQEIEVNLERSKRDFIAFSVRVELAHVPVGKIHTIRAEAYRENNRFTPSIMETLKVIKVNNVSREADAIYGILLLPLSLSSEIGITASSLSDWNSSRLSKIYEVLLEEFNSLTMSDRYSSKSFTRENEEALKAFRMYHVSDVYEIPSTEAWYGLNKSEVDVILDLKHSQNRGLPYDSNFIDSNVVDPNLIDLVVYGDLNIHNIINDPSRQDMEESVVIKLSASDVASQEHLRFPQKIGLAFQRILADMMLSQNIKFDMEWLALTAAKRIPRLQAKIKLIDIAKRRVKIDFGKRDGLFPGMKVWFYTVDTPRNGFLQKICPGFIAEVFEGESIVHSQMDLSHLETDLLMITK